MLGRGRTNDIPRRPAPATRYDTGSEGRMPREFSDHDVERILEHEWFLRDNGRSEEAGHAVNDHLTLSKDEILNRYAERQQQIKNLGRQQDTRDPLVTAWDSWGDMVKAAHLVLNAPHTQAALPVLTTDGSRNSRRRAVIKYYNRIEQFWLRRVRNITEERVARAKFQDLVMVLDCIRGRDLPFDLQVHTFYGTESPTSRSHKERPRAMGPPRNSVVVYQRDVSEENAHWVESKIFWASSEVLHTTNGPVVVKIPTRKQPYKTINWLVPY